MSEKRLTTDTLDGLGAAMLDKKNCQRATMGLLIAIGAFLAICLHAILSN